MWRSRSLYKQDATFQEWKSEPENVAGWPSSLLKALRSNCELHLVYLQWRTAQRELSTRYNAGVLVCERAHGTYIAERRFSELVRKHGYKPGGGAIALSSRAISRMDKLASGHRDFCMYISRRSSYDHQEYSAPQKNTKASTWNNGAILTSISAHASDWVLMEIRGARTLQRLARITTTAEGTSAREFAKQRDTMRLSHLADTHMVSGV